MPRRPSSGTPSRRRHRASTIALASGTLALAALFARDVLAQSAADIRAIRAGSIPNSTSGRVGAARTISVLIVPLRWQGGDASYLRPQLQEPLWRDVRDFWSRETYGQQTLDITIGPQLDSAKPMPGCNHGTVLAEAQSLARAAGYTKPYDRYVILSTPGCGMQWATLGPVMFGYTYVSHAGKAAHEMGHSFGLLHSHSSVAAENEYGVYGNRWEIMSGIWPELPTWHFNAYDKSRLGVLTPLPCADATLRPIEEAPDAIECGPLWAEVHQDGAVWVFKQEMTPSNYGAADNTRMAILQPGQSYAGFRNAGSGLVNARQL